MYLHRQFLIFLLIFAGLSVVALQGNDLPPEDYKLCDRSGYNRENPGNTCDPDSVINGYGLPFREDWSSGSFETLQWTISSSNWVISDDEGMPSPAAEFSGTPVQNDYMSGLESYPINCTGVVADEIWLDYNLKLDCLQPSVDEKLKVQIWDGSNNIWVSINLFNGGGGSFDWKDIHVSIKPFALEKVFKIRFLALGVNSAHIQSWLIDNIKIYCSCAGPDWIAIEEHEDFNLIYWNDPGNMNYTCLQWDDSIPNTGIGTGSEVEFEVAARWTPEQLLDYSGESIYQIGFIPAEQDANYRVRIWSGSGPDTMVFDQAVTDPVINQWNYISLAHPQNIDVSKDLWIGYYTSTPYGYPASVDDGPAIDGYGNMINWQGWQTLLNINPELKFNWNINCLIGTDPYNQNLYFNLYRSTDEGEFQQYDTVYQLEYFDNNILLADHYCYQVGQVKINGIDTCESILSDTVCETVNVGTNEPEVENGIKIYPNPAKNWLHVVSEEEIRRVKLYNMLGEEMLKLEIRNSDYIINVSNFPGGIYYVNVITNRGEFKKKVLIFR